MKPVHLILNHIARTISVAGLSMSKCLTMAFVSECLVAARDSPATKRAKKLPNKRVHNLKSKNSQN